MCNFYYKEKRIGCIESAFVRRTDTVHETIQKPGWSSFSACENLLSVFDHLVLKFRLWKR